MSEDAAMSEDYATGGFYKFGGRIKEAAGVVTGNPRLKAEGQFDQVKGGVHQAWGNLKNAARDLAERFHKIRI
jgi:uncharacterized protein YjbJ (UPF0337 family)